MKMNMQKIRKELKKKGISEFSSLGREILHNIYHASADGRIVMIKNEIEPVWKRFSSYVGWGFIGCLVGVVIVYVLQKIFF